LLDAGAAPGFFLRFGLRTFSSIVGSQTYLRQVYGLDAASIAGAVLSRLRPRGRARYGYPRPAAMASKASSA
jgi:hypothetical protein